MTRPLAASLGLFFASVPLALGASEYEGAENGAEVAAVACATLPGRTHQ